MSENWPGQMPEVEKEKNSELTEDEKSRLYLMWVNSVLGNESVQESLDGKTNQEIKEWMYVSLMNEIGKLVDEWELESDNNLVAEIEHEVDSDKKADLELRYIMECHKKVDDFVKKFESNPNIKSTRWSSWPSTMREKANFNCVGASLVGLNLLDNVGIENYWGNPVGHVVNVVKLSNGKWWYVDFRNGSVSVRKIDPEITKIAGVDVLKINDDFIDYRSIPIHSKEECGLAIVGNIEQLKKEADDPEIIMNNDDTNEARKFRDRNGVYIEGDFQNIKKKIYGKSNAINDSVEIREERERIRELFGFGDEASKFMMELSIEDRKIAKAELANKIIEIRSFFLDNGDGNDFTANAKSYLELYRQALKNAKNKNPEFFVEMVNRLLFRIEEYKKTNEK